MNRWCLLTIKYIHIHILNNTTILTLLLHTHLWLNRILSDWNMRSLQLLWNNMNCHKCYSNKLESNFSMQISSPFICHCNLQNENIKIPPWAISFPNRWLSAIVPLLQLFTPSKRSQQLTNDNNTPVNSIPHGQSPLHFLCLRSWVVNREKTITVSVSCQL